MLYTYTNSLSSNFPNKVAREKGKFFLYPLVPVSQSLQAIPRGPVAYLSIAGHMDSYQVLSSSPENIKMPHCH